MGPNLKTKNKIGELMKLAKKYAKEISFHKGIIGITIGGGLARGYVDEFSDIDLNIYLDSRTFHMWKNKKCPVILGDHYWKGQLSEIEIYDYQEEKKRDWTLQERWEKKSEIIFKDTNSKIKNLLKEKIIWKDGEKSSSLKFIKEMSEWYVTELAWHWIKRGDIVQSHYVLNHSIDWILDYVLIKNNQFIPFAKWKVHYALLAKNKPNNFNKQIRECMKIKEFNEKDVLRRQKVLLSLLKNLRIIN